MIIAFGYQSRVGKDACVAAILKNSSVISNEYGKRPARSAFADLLKRVAHDLFGIYAGGCLRGGDPGR